MNKLYALGRRSVVAGGALLLGVAASLPALLITQPVFATAAGGQVQSRSIKMSSSSTSATASSVKYDVTFTAASTVASVKAVVVDFCAGGGSNTPIVGDSNCSAPTGFSVGTPTFTNNPDTVANNASVSGWTATALNSGRTFQITNAAGVATTAGTSVFNFSIDTVTNPTTRGTFYARVITYTTSSPTYAPGSEGSYQDYGGFALSTVDNISITAKVFETLTFCVYTGGACGTAPSLALGDTTTGALSTASTYVNANTKYDLGTNAAHGVAVVMKGTTLCDTGVLATCQSGTASSNTITPMNTTPAAATSSTGTAEQFGMCADKNSSAALTVAPAYIDSLANCHGLTTGVLATANTFGFDNTNVTGTSGSTVISSTGAVPSVTGGFAFAANITPTTEAGIYTTTLNMIATSTF